MMRKTLIQIVALWLILSVFLAACNAVEKRNEKQNVDGNTVRTNTENSTVSETSNADEIALAKKTPTKQNSDAPDNAPKTPREFFMLLPEKYFRLEAVNSKSQNVRRAKEEFLKTRLEVEDNANGYLRAFADGAQPGITIALFKYPGGSYLVGVETVGEGENTNYFLEYEKGKWSEAAERIVPDYGTDKFYELPRYGTIVGVFKRQPEEEAGDGEKGAKLYNLVWKDGKFTIQK